jgi:hypothetical protein
MKLVAPNGKEICGTSEELPGVALIREDSFGRDESGNLVWDWDGETKILWDGQRTSRINGKILFVDGDGNEWGEYELRLVGEEERVGDEHD